MPIILSLCYAFCWGIGLTLSKAALTGLSAPTLLVIQLTASVSVLAGLCYWRDRHLCFSWNSLKQGVAGIFEPGLAYIVGTVGLDLTTASNAALIGASEVILTLVLAALVLRETLTRTQLGLAGLSTIGIVLLLWQGANTTDSASLLGDSLVLLGTLFAVFYVLLSKRQVAIANPLHLTTAQQLVGLGLTVFGYGLLSWLFASPVIHLAGISLSLWGLAILSGVLQYALAFWVYLTVLQTMPASQAAFFVALIPVFGVTSALALLGEQLQGYQVFGGVLVVLASYLANRRSQAA